MTVRECVVVQVSLGHRLENPSDLEHGLVVADVFDEDELDAPVQRRDLLGGCCVSELGGVVRVGGANAKKNQQKINHNQTLTSLARRALVELVASRMATWPPPPSK